MTDLAVRLVVEGRVQGVGYRWWARERALSLGLRGWVRNRRDGSVELLAMGPADAVERFAAACLDGPPGARVQSVTRLDADAVAFVGFEERPTV
ncbi:MAG: acylphosphatase [Caulobacteraceae bacterium]|nr:acylphosphatase [Caulobacteraceae bacterium]